MGLEIDFLPVGSESNGGDAITVRYGNLYGSRAEQTVIVVDGGFKENGEALVDHIGERFHTSHVDLVVSTHPDQDHASGLSVVLENCSVDSLWMHLPWNHSGDMARLRESNFSTSSLDEAVTASLQNISELEEIARRKSIPIVEPFTGLSTPDGMFRVVGPSQAYYEELLTGVVEGQSTAARILASVDQILDRAAQRLLPEDLYQETLTDTGSTTPRNNSSVISLISSDEQLALLTGDAGAPALNRAIDQLASQGIGTGELTFVQVPHHGSRRNVGPSVLDRLLGPKGQVVATGAAFVSGPKKNPDHKHPSKKVTNAFRRRGYPTYATQGDLICNSHNAPPRAGFSPIQPLPLYGQVEADGDDP